MVKFLRAKFWTGDKRMAESEAMQTETGRAPLASGELTESPAPAMAGTVSEFTRGKEYKVRAERQRG